MLRWVWRVVRALIAVIIVLIVVSAFHIARAWYSDVRESEPVPPGMTDDASRMNRTSVREIIHVSDDPAKAESQIRDAIAFARRNRTGVAIAGYKHTQGGQTIAPVVLDVLPHNRFELRGEVLHAQSGAQWVNILPELDKHGRSLDVMQSDNPFTVGGSLSVNVHGWQHHHEPIASTVLSMNVLRPDGTVVHCSPAVNRELFSNVLGGYGLFGVILDADLRTVPNELYRVQRKHCNVDNYEATFDRKTNDPNVRMAYGRVSVAPGSFLKDAVITTFHLTTGKIPELKSKPPSKFERAVFRAQVGSAFGKWLRWKLERFVGPLIEPSVVSRNMVLNEDPAIYLDYGPKSTGIVHEYFVPRGKLAAFMHAIDPILRQEKADLLNITFRDVRKDNVTALAFARRDVFAVVMYFHQERTPKGDAAMQRVTQRLIDAALDQGGSYYLPYRSHATAQQLERAYPNVRGFFAAKRRDDPNEVFVNQWYLKYR